MTKGECYRKLVYYREHIYLSFENKSEHNEMMFLMYTHLYESGHYKKLPHDSLSADAILRDRGCPVCGKRQRTGSRSSTPRSGGK
jgi:hypothetical protein